MYTNNNSLLFSFAIALNSKSSAFQSYIIFSVVVHFMIYKTPCIYIFILINIFFCYFKCMEFNVVSGTTGRVKYIRNDIVTLEKSTGIIPVFPVFTNGQSYYPLTPAYSSTVHKIIGQDMAHVTLVFKTRSYRLLSAMLP